MSTRVVFMGSPEFALPSLDALVQNFDVIGVVTKPDRPAGRGKQLTSPPVKILADELDIPVIQPKRLSEADSMSALKEWMPDLIVVTAFGQILRSEVLDLPRYGCINVHASLLPRWRGAAPIQAAILHGDQRTGVTIMKMDEGLDTGPTISQRDIILSGEDTAGGLSPKLAQLGADLLIETLPEYLSGKLRPTPQQGESTYASMLKKSDGELDFTQSAIDIERKIRAYHPWPGTFMMWNEQRVKINRARVAESDFAAGKKNLASGDHVIIEDHPGVKTAEGIILFDELQPAGKKSMPGPAFLLGARKWA
jgi:methionyl-tRNA formyltransferase